MRPTLWRMVKALELLTGTQNNDHSYVVLRQDGTPIEIGINEGNVSTRRVVKSLLVKFKVPEEVIRIDSYTSSIYFGICHIKDGIPNGWIRKFFRGECDYRGFDIPITSFCGWDEWMENQLHPFRKVVP